MFYSNRSRVPVFVCHNVLPVGSWHPALFILLCGKKFTEIVVITITTLIMQVHTKSTYILRRYTDVCGLFGMLPLLCVKKKPLRI